MRGTRGSRRALPGALPAEDRGPVPRRVRAGRAGGRRRRSSRSAPSASRSASPSRSSTTCSTSPGRPERTGKPRGADLLDGTVTLPLILARERDPALAALDLRASAPRPTRPVSATGSRPRARSTDREVRALELVAEAKARAAADLPIASAARSSWSPTASSSATHRVPALAATAA